MQIKQKAEARRKKDMTSRVPTQEAQTQTNKTDKNGEGKLF